MKAKRSSNRRLRVESLECRQLLTSQFLDALAVPNENAVSNGAVSIQTEILSAEASDTVAIRDSQRSVGDSTRVSISLPQGLPEVAHVDLELQGEAWTLRLEKHDVFGSNTRFLVDDGLGNLVEIEKGLDRSYLGTVVQKPHHYVSAQLTEHGLMASVVGPDGMTLIIEPDLDSRAVDGHRVHFVMESEHPHGWSDSSTLAAQALAEPNRRLDGHQTPFSDSSHAFADENHGGDAHPSAFGMPSDVYEFEVGVEIGSRAFFASTAYNGNLSIAQASAASVATNMDARYLHATGIKHTVGTVIIRTNTTTDPLRSVVTATGGAPDASFSLSAFRDYWNNSPGEVGTTHDIAVYHVLSAPSGLAYVNSVGTSNRYATSGGNGATSWANGTVVHEFGHSWSLPHVGSGLFYESKPRNFSGSNAAGGEDVFVSIMHGGGDHNIGRMATDEANQVFGVRQNKLPFGNPYSPGPVRPFGHRDLAFAGENPIVIDVAANDFDVNDDALNVQLLDTVSQKGAQISLSVGTGPGGRNEIVYTPPAVSTGERDFFHYTVVDSTGRSDWGAVYVDSAAIGVNIAQDKFSYDFGTSDSPVFSNVDTQAVRVSPATTGDVTWSAAVQAVDRATPGQNAYNRDLVFGNLPVTWSHKVQNGRWRVVVNMSDPEVSLDNMFVNAEGTPGLTNLDRPAGQNQTVAFEVDVLDGELNLEFGDADINSPLWAVNRVVLEQVAEYVPPLLQGDYNRDGIVDAADFTLFRDHEGQSVLNPFDNADGNGNRIVDAGDYLVWRDNFGATLLETPLIDAVLGNGEFAVDRASDVSALGGGSDDITIILDRDRALRSTGQTGRGLSILGWDFERLNYSGGNAAFGTDGTYGFATNPGTGPGQTGQAFVNSGAIEVRSAPITRAFSQGEQIELSYLLGTDTGSFVAVDATVSLIFDQGLATEQTWTFDTQTAAGLNTPAISETYRLVSDASTLSVGFLLDGGSSIRTLLDKVEVSSIRSSATRRLGGTRIQAFAGTASIPSAPTGSSTNVVDRQNRRIRNMFGRPDIESQEIVIVPAYDPRHYRATHSVENKAPSKLKSDSLVVGIEKMELQEVFLGL